MIPQPQVRKDTASTRRRTALRLANRTAIRSYRTIRTDGNAIAVSPHGIAAPYLPCQRGSEPTVPSRTNRAVCQSAGAVRALRGEINRIKRSPSALGPACGLLRRAPSDLVRGERTMWCPRAPTMLHAEPHHAVSRYGLVLHASCRSITQSRERVSDVSGHYAGWGRVGGPLAELHSPLAYPCLANKPIVTAVERVSAM